MLTRTIRRLLRQPSAPVLAVVTLALGLGISTAVLGSVVPAMRAARTDPMVALRDE